MKITKEETLAILMDKRGFTYHDAIKIYNAQTSKPKTKPTLKLTKDELIIVLMNRHGLSLDGAIKLCDAQIEKQKAVKQPPPRTTKKPIRRGRDPPPRKKWSRTYPTLSKWQSFWVGVIIGILLVVGWLISILGF